MMRPRLSTMLLLAAASVGLGGCVVAEVPSPPPVSVYGYYGGYYGRPYAYVPPRYYAPPPPPRYYYPRPYYRY